MLSMCWVCVQYRGLKCFEWWFYYINDRICRNPTKVCDWVRTHPFCIGVSVLLHSRHLLPGYFATCIQQKMVGESLARIWSFRMGFISEPLILPSLAPLAGQNLAHRKLIMCTFQDIVGLWDCCCAVQGCGAAYNTRKTRAGTRAEFMAHGTPRRRALNRAASLAPLASFPASARNREVLDFPIGPPHPKHSN